MNGSTSRRAEVARHRYSRTACRALTPLTGTSMTNGVEQRVHSRCSLFELEAVRAAFCYVADDASTLRT
jgi:hypothetical protein